MCRLKKTLLSIFFSACCMAMSAQPGMPSLSVGDANVLMRIDTRIDGQYTYFGNEKNEDGEDYEFGMQGSYLNLRLEGVINEHFSYSMSYRLYKSNNPKQAYFNATDWVNLVYKPNKRWNISAGKQVVAVGTYEYDVSPLDVYFASLYWDNCNPYQMGVSVAYNFDEGNQLIAQVTNSPYNTNPLNGTFAYNLMWYGRIAPWLNTTYSVNMLEYEKGRFINYLAIGHKVRVGNVVFDIDWMNRYGGHGTHFFKDFTLVGNVDWFLGKFNLEFKGGIDYNKAQKEGEKPYDTWIKPGTNRVFGGLMMEYHPINGQRDKVRVHACYNTTSDRRHQVQVGVRWKMDLLKLKF